MTQFLDKYTTEIRVGDSVRVCDGPITGRVTHLGKNIEVQAAHETGYFAGPVLVVLCRADGTPVYRYKGNEDVRPLDVYTAQDGSKCAVSEKFKPRPAAPSQQAQWAECTLVRRASIANQSDYGELLGRDRDGVDVRKGDRVEDDSGRGFVAFWAQQDGNGLIFYDEAHGLDCYANHCRVAPKSAETKIQKVEIAITSNHEPSRVAREVGKTLAELARAAKERLAESGRHIPRQPAKVYAGRDMTVTIGDKTMQVPTVPVPEATEPEWRPYEHVEGLRKYIELYLHGDGSDLFRANAPNVTLAFVDVVGAWDTKPLVVRLECGSCFQEVFLYRIPDERIDETLEEALEALARDVGEGAMGR